jgi:hypothetical protein
MDALDDKRKRNAEYMRLYRQRSKANTSSVAARSQNAERVRLHRQRIKAGAFATTTTTSISDAASSNGIAAATPSGLSVTCDSAEPSTSTVSDEHKKFKNTTVEQDDDTEDENDVTAIYKYSDATFNLNSRLVKEAAACRLLISGKPTLYGVMPIAYVRDEREYTARWAMADHKFDGMFSSNEFGTACSVYDRLWFARDVRPVLQKHLAVLQSYFRDEDVQRFVVCSNCYRHLESGRLAPMNRWYDFRYPLKPTHLPPLDDISARLVSPRLPFMQLRRLQHDTGSKTIIGQIVNVPVDVGDMIRRLPRNLEDDRSINVHIKKKIENKSSNLQGHVKKSVLRAWLEYLLQQSLYKLYNKTFDRDTLNSVTSVNDDDVSDRIETLDAERACDSDVLAARQRTLMWEEDMCLHSVPGQHKTPLSNIYDEHEEELSFPEIYYGVARKFKGPRPPRPYMIATSEIRRRNRRGVTPDYVLYMGMKILRLRVFQNIQHSFVCNKENERITRAEIQNADFLKENLEKKSLS